MRSWCVLVVVCIAACQPQPHLPIGAWSSDRELSLASLAQDASLSKSHHAALEDPTLFGQNVQVYTLSGGAGWFEGECSPFPSFSVVESRPGFARIRYRDVVFKTEEEKTITWDANFLYLPLAGGRASEVFRRIPVSEAITAHPCLESALGPRS